MKEAMIRSQKDGMAEKRDGEAQGRVNWKRKGWPDAKFAARDPPMRLFEEELTTGDRAG